jgi:hypothetical protein
LACRFPPAIERTWSDLEQEIGGSIDDHAFAVPWDSPPRGAWWPTMRQPFGLIESRWERGGSMPGEPSVLEDAPPRPWPRIPSKGACELASLVQRRPTRLRLRPTRLKSLLKRLLGFPRDRRPVLASQPMLEGLFRRQVQSRWSHPSSIPSGYAPSQVTSHSVALLEPWPRRRLAMHTERARAEVVGNPSSPPLQDHIGRRADPHGLRHGLLGVPEPPSDPLQLSPRHSAPSLMFDTPLWATIAHREPCPRPIPCCTHQTTGRWSCHNRSARTSPV